MGSINSRQKGASSEREFAGLIHDQLGVKLADEVLPFSNFPGMVIPFFADARKTLVRKA